MPCRHYRVTGIVQGVFFRASTQEQGSHIGLHGWVKNMPDGTVEAVACGTEDQLTRFEKWIKQGPPLARVDQLDITTITVEFSQQDFIIKY